MTLLKALHCVPMPLKKSNHFPFFPTLSFFLFYVTGQINMRGTGNEFQENDPHKFTVVLSQVMMA